MISIDPVRWCAAALLLVAYLALCGYQWRARRRQLAREVINPAAATPAQPWLVVYASQSGNALALAQQTAALLQSAGSAVRCLNLSQLDWPRLQAAQRILFIVATCGEGDAPDNAADFASKIMQKTPALPDLRYGLLALGDSSYQHFCGFARELDRWLATCGAHAQFARIEVDRLNPAAIESWQQALQNWAGASAGGIDAWQRTPMQSWRISERRCLNPGSAGSAVYELRLQPEDLSATPLPHWQAGDLVQICPPQQPDAARQYSIASTPAEGHIRLLVRLRHNPDGSIGTASGWLCLQAEQQAPLTLRVQPHPGFQLGPNAQAPALFIANGTGLAGVRAHLKTRIDAGIHSNWLIFGERHAGHDFYFQQEIEHWQQSGHLSALACCFSRQHSPARYVQHALAEQAERLRELVQQGGAIYVCGSLRGMAAGVDAVLRAVLGEAGVTQLAAAGRYRRDVY